MLASVKSGNDVPVDILRDAVLFNQSFVDRCHHGKEESCLFQCLETRGIPREGGPIGVMLYEHQIGREMVRKIQSLLEAYEADLGAKNELLRVCSEYVAHLRQHIFKEENILFQMGDAVMNQEDNMDSVECYERTEEQTLGPGKHEEMLNLAKKIGASKH
jgi:hemerythrin-like domain-containing protein